MALHNYQKVRDLSLTDEMDGLMVIRAPFDGKIRTLNIWLGGNLAQEGIANISLNGSDLFTDTDRLIMSAGAAAGEKAGMDEAISKGDIISVDAESVGAGGWTGRMMVQLELDDEIVNLVADDGSFGSFDEKTTPHNDDLLLLEDTEDGGAKKKIKISNLPSGSGGGLDTEAVQDIVGAMMVSGTNTLWTYDDVAGTLQVDAAGLTDEEIQDKVAAFLAAGSNVSINYNDPAGTLTISSTQRTNEEIMDVVAALLQQGSNVTLTYNDGADTLTIAASGGGGGSLPSQTGKAGKFLYTDGTSESWQWTPIDGVDATPTAGNSSDDEEFNGDSLPAAWTVDTNTAVTAYYNSLVRGWLVAKFSGTTGAYSISKNFSANAAVAFSLTMAVAGNPYANTHLIYFTVMDTGNNNSINFNFGFSGGGRKMIINTRAAGVDTFERSTATVSVGNFYYLRIVRSAGNVWTAFYSSDCINWSAMSLSYTLSFDVSKLKIAMECNGGAIAGFVPAIKWIRRDWVFVS